MIQEVSFQGLTHSPSDHESADGELGTCLNLINEDGALHTIAQPQVAEANITIPDGASIVLVHKVTHSGTIHSHYIVRRKDGTYYWLERGGDGTATDISLGSFSVNAVTAVGNILCFVGDSKTIYAYWKDTAYVVIDLTQVKYSGAIVKESGEKTYDVIEPTDVENVIDDHTSSDHYVKFKDTISANNCQTLFLAKDTHLNKKMGEESFKYIQFGVLALRLYDGSRIKIGNPFTITDGEGVDNNIYLWYAGTDGTYNLQGEGTKFSYSGGTTYAVHLAQSLFKCKLTIDLPYISEYEDIIDGIDVFVSNSIYPYKTSVEISKTQVKASSGDDSTDNYLAIQTEEYGRLNLYAKSYLIGDICVLGHWQYPAMTQDELNEEISKLTFYKSISFTYNDIANGTSKYLKRITQTESSLSLADSQRASYGAKVAITYNNRLHLANVSTPVCDTVNGNVKSGAGVFSTAIIHVKYKYNDQTMEVWQRSYMSYPYDPMISFPSDDVTLYELYASYNGYYYRKVVDVYNQGNIGISFFVNYLSGKLQRNSFNDSEKISTSVWREAYSNATNFEATPGNSPSLVKVSEAENPLVFPAANSVQVGSSIISALAANTRPISEGQFGEAPLYAFTDEGVWALMTSQTGTYDARQPTSRDICSNPSGILQIDDAVLYPTERGIMMQQGREAKCITGALDGYPLDFTQLYKEEYAKKVLAIEGVGEDAVKYVRFRDYLQGADMIYDYYDNRIIVFNPSHAYAYVYSIKGGTWGTMTNAFQKRANIYPDAYATDKDGRIIDAYVRNPTDDVTYLLCSRPLALSGGDIYKTMFSSIARGYFRDAAKGKCALVLYGSNDLFHWFPIKTSVHKYLRGMAGSPYKHFRIALTGKLSPDETISGLTAEFQERWQNKLR